MPTAKVDKATAAAHEIVAAVSGRKIRVLGYSLVAAGAVTAKWVSGSTDLTGAMTMATGIPNNIPPGGNSLDPVPVLECAHGEALNLTLSGAVQVSGWVRYDIVG